MLFWCISILLSVSEKSTFNLFLEHEDCYCLHCLKHCIQLFFSSLFNLFICIPCVTKSHIFTFDIVSLLKRKTVTCVSRLCYRLSRNRGKKCRWGSVIGGSGLGDESFAAAESEGLKARPLPARPEALAPHPRPRHCGDQVEFLGTAGDSSGHGRGGRLHVRAEWPPAGQRCQGL